MFDLKVTEKSTFSLDDHFINFINYINDKRAYLTKLLISNKNQGTTPEL